MKFYLIIKSKLQINNFFVVTPKHPLIYLTYIVRENKEKRALIIFVGKNIFYDIILTYNNLLLYIDVCTTTNYRMKHIRIKNKTLVVWQRKRKSIDPIFLSRWCPNMFCLLSVLLSSALGIMSIGYNLCYIIRPEEMLRQLDFYKTLFPFRNHF